MKWLTVRLLCAAIMLAVAAPFAAAAPPVPTPTPTLEVTIPVWHSDYRWPVGDGYAGWDRGVFGGGLREAYGLETGLGGNPGLWAWPLGDREYRPGGAEWVLHAPGTTRIARAELDLGYRTNLFAHHCLEAGLRVGAERLDGRRDCKPPTPPIREDNYRLVVNDPSATPTAKEAFVRLELPECLVGTELACSKHLPALDPLTEGPHARLNAVSLVLVDDDLPVVTPSKAFFALDGTYIDGKQTYALRVDATDAGAGITRIDLDHSGWPGPQPKLVDQASECDPRHHTATLEARVCPPADAAELNVDTPLMPEGTRSFRAYATDPAGNVGDRRWTVIIDRTAPPAPPALTFLTPDEGSGQARWEPSIDPVLPDGTPGSGVVGYRVRHRIGSGPWSEPQALGAGERLSDDLFDHPAGTRIAFEVVAVDAVGNVSEPSTVAGEVTGAVPEVDADPLGDRGTEYIAADVVRFPVYARDAQTGVRRTWTHVDDGTGHQEVDAGCVPTTRPDGQPWKALCPAALDATFTLDGGALPEGAHVVVVGAEDRAHNVTEERYDIGVDRTAPAMPREIELFAFDPEDHVVGVTWDEGEDPDLPDGTPGAGVARTEYQVLQNGTASGWKLPDDDGVTVGGITVGERVTVQARSTDEAGNVSQVAERSFTISERIPEQPALAAVTAQTLATNAEPDAQAATLGDNCRIRRSPSFRKQGSRLVASWTAGCVGQAWATVQVRILKVDPGIFDPDDELDEDREDGPREGYVSVAANAGCRQGRQTYKATFLLTSPALNGRSEVISRTITRRYTCGADDDEERHPCLKPSAQYHTTTRSEFKWNLCVMTKRYFSGNIAQAHHMLPIAFEGTFRRYGVLNIHDPVWGTWWRQPDHSQNTWAYNRAWDRFLDRQRTPEAIRQFACDLANDHHLSVRFCAD